MNFHAKNPLKIKFIIFAKEKWRIIFSVKIEIFLGNFQTVSKNNNIKKSANFVQKFFEKVLFSYSMHIITLIFTFFFSLLDSYRHSSKLGYAYIAFDLQTC